MAMQLHRGAPPNHMRKLEVSDLPMSEQVRYRRHGGVPPRKRASGEMERYLPTDGRVEPQACQHTQIRDEKVGATAWCLDCGYLLDIMHNWSQVPGVEPMTDSDLTERRRYHNDFWFDKLYKMRPSDPDDPEREARVQADLVRRGIERL